MRKSLNVVLATLVAGGVSLAVAQASVAMPDSSAQRFSRELNTLERESSPMWIPNVHVNRYARPEDPVPTATTLAQREAWFNQESHLLQAQSRGGPTVSPPVNPHEPAADPLPRATTPAQKMAALAAQEQFLQREATP
jgi:hypothetical protein